MERPTIGTGQLFIIPMTSGGNMAETFGKCMCAS